MNTINGASQKCAHGIGSAFLSKRKFSPLVDWCFCKEKTFQCFSRSFNGDSQTSCEKNTQIRHEWPSRRQFIYRVHVAVPVHHILHASSVNDCFLRAQIFIWSGRVGTKCYACIVRLTGCAKFARQVRGMSDPSFSEKCTFPSHGVWLSSYFKKSIFLRSDSNSCTKWHLANGYHFNLLTYFSYSFLLWRMHKKFTIICYPFLLVQLPHNWTICLHTNHKYIVLNRKWAPFYESF